MNDKQAREAISSVNAWMLESLGNWARDVGGNPTSEDVDEMVTDIEVKFLEVLTK